MKIMNVMVILLLSITIAGCANYEQDIPPTSVIEREEISTSSSQESVESLESFSTASSSPTSSMPSPESGNDRVIPLGFTAETLAQFEKAYTEGALEDFVAQNPDFLFVNIVRVSYGADAGGAFPMLTTQSTNATMLETQTHFTAEEVLINHKRLEEFYHNYDNHIPDTIIILSSGPPIPLWIKVYEFDGEKVMESIYTVGYMWDEDRLDIREYAMGVESVGFRETDTEWIVSDDGERIIRYPKFGYMPKPITEETLEETLLERWGDTHKISTETRETSAVIKNGKAYTFYDVVDENNIMIGDLFAVADDFSRYFSISMVAGEWYLMGQVTQSAENP